MTHGNKVVAALRNLLVEKYGAATQANWAKLDGPQVAAAIDAAFPERNRALPHPEWIASLKADPANEGVDIDALMERCREWCRQHDRKATRKVFMGFLANADRTLGTNGQPVKTFSEIRGWIYLLKERRAEGLFNKAIPCEWEELDDPTKRFIHDQRKHVADLAAFAERNSGAFYARLKQIEERNAE
jgi:hypothetical protein